jgi:F0F1-type ATP synthase membrane subunit b/b'
MASKDQDLLDKLFAVEKKAEALVNEARMEADRRIAAAKDKAEMDHGAAYEAAVKEATARKALAVETAISEYDGAIEEFHRILEGTRVDEKAFRSACELGLNN